MGFVTSALAWATLGLITIPIVIHLINRRQFRRVDWAAMEFLLKALRRNRRRIRFEQLLLLLMRIALMVLLGLAFARPIVSSGRLEWFGGFLRSEEKVFVLDDSFSTRQRTANRTLFRREIDALTATLDHLAQRGGSDRVTILKGTRYSSPIVRAAFLDEERSVSLSQHISTLGASDARLPLVDLLEELATRQAERSADTPGRPWVVSILTDLRASDWTGADGSPRRELHRALRRLTENEEAPARIVLVDVGSDEEKNVALTGARLVAGGPIAGVGSQFDVEVANFGKTEASGLRLALRYAPIPQALSDTPGWVNVTGPSLRSLPAGERDNYRLTCTFRNPGPHAIYVELHGANDSLPEDDVVPLAVNVLEAFDVLLVNGEPASEAFAGETDFLEVALAPPGDVVSGIRTDIVVEDNLPRGSLDDYATVFLCNLFAVPEDFLLRVKRYAESGGCVVVFLGDQVDAGLYNSRLGPPPSDAVASDSTTTGPTVATPASVALLPARLGELLTAAPEPARLSPNLDHPYFRSVRDVEDAFDLTRFQTYFSVTPTAEAEVIAHFTDAQESPAVIEHGVGAGRVILFTTSADAEWNDWPRSATYLVLLQDLITSVSSSRVQGNVAEAGAPLEVVVDIGRYSQETTLRGPGYPTTPERTLVAAPLSSAAEAQAAFHVRTTDTHRSGHYALRLLPKDGGEEWRQFAYQSPEVESQLERVSGARLAELYPDIELTVVKNTTQITDVGRGRFEIADGLLAMFLALLFVEGFAAWRFARHRRSTVGPAEGGL